MVLSWSCYQNIQNLNSTAPTFFGYWLKNLECLWLNVRKSIIPILISLYAKFVCLSWWLLHLRHKWKTRPDIWLLKSRAGGQGQWLLIKHFGRRSNTKTTRKCRKSMTLRTNQLWDGLTDCKVIEVRSMRLERKYPGSTTIYSTVQLPHSNTGRTQGRIF